MAGNRLYRASIMTISVLQTGIILLALIEISTANSCCPPRKNYRSCCRDWRFRRYRRFPITYPRFVSGAPTLPTRLPLWMFINQNARGHFPTRYNTNSQTSSPSHFNRNELTRTSTRVNWNELTRTPTRVNWNELTGTSTRVYWNATPPPTRSTLGGPILPSRFGGWNPASRSDIRYNWNGQESSTHQQRNYPTVSNNVTSPSTRYNWSTLPSSANFNWNYSTVSTSRFQWKSQQNPMTRWFISTSSSTRFSPQNVTPTPPPSDMACSSGSRPLKIYAEPNETGTIQSPGYPNNYSNNAICEWIVETVPGYQIQLFVQTMYLEFSTSCDYDYVEISYVLYYYPRNQLRMCTYTNQSIQSHGKSMSIRFTSDSSITASGFTLKYTSVAYSNMLPTATGKYVATNTPAFLDWTLARISTTRVNWNNGTTSPTPRYGWGNLTSTSFSFWYHLRTSSSNVLSMCPLTTIYAYPGSDEYIKYPVYSNVYPNNADCRWLITAGYGYVVRVFISSMSVESPTLCAHDYLEIFDGITIYYSRLLKTCFPSSRYVYSTGQYMLLRFVSDVSLTFSGFNLSYTTILRSDVPVSTTRFSWNIQTTSSTPRYRWDVPPSTTFNIWNIARTSSSNVATACPPAAVFNPQPGSGGQISYPVYPNLYPDNADCRWLIRAAPGYVVRFFISRMDVEKPSLCVHDYLEVFDGPNIHSPLLIKTCSLSPYFYSSGQDVLFRFVSDHSVTDYGFSLTYTTILRSNVPAHWKFRTTLNWNFPTISTNRFSWNIKTASSTPSIRWGIPSTSSTFNILDPSRTTSPNGSSCACRSWSQPCYLALSAGQSNVIEFPDPSTDYPTNATNLTCAWIISTNSRDYVVQVNTDFFALTPGSDLLTVYDGSSSADGLLLRSFPSEQNVHVIGTAQTMYIEFVSKGSFTSSKFRLNCTAVLRQEKSLFVTPIQQNLSTSSGGNANLLSFINIALGITSLLTCIGIVLYLFIRLRHNNSATSFRACKSPGIRPNVYTNRPRQDGIQNTDRYQNINGITAPCSSILASGSHVDNAVYNNPAFREVDTEFTQQSTDDGSFGSTRHLLQIGDAFVVDEE